MRVMGRQLTDGVVSALAGRQHAPLPSLGTLAVRIRESA
jgi:hypothetical protein